MDYTFKNHDNETFVQNLKLTLFDVLARNQESVAAIEEAIATCTDPVREDELRTLWATYHEAIKVAMNSTNTLSNAIKELDNCANVYLQFVNGPSYYSVDTDEKSSQEMTATNETADSSFTENANVEYENSQAPSQENIVENTVDVDTNDNALESSVESSVLDAISPVDISSVATEQEAPVAEANEVVAAEQETPVAEANEVVAAEQEAPVAEANEVVAAEQETPVAEANDVVVAEQEAPVAEANEVVAAEQEAPVAEANEVVATEQETPATEANDVVAAEQEAPVAEANEVVATEQEAPVAEANEVVATEQETPATEANEVVATEQEAPAMEANDVVAAEQEAPVAEANEVVATAQETPATEAVEAVTEIKPVIQLPMADESVSNEASDNNPLIPLSEEVPNATPLASLSEEVVDESKLRYYKDSLNDDKAILINQKQAAKLRASKDVQKALMSSKTNVSSEEVTEKQIEKMMNQLSSLYEQGKTQEAEAMSEKISVLSKKLNASA